jgi:hypothetical protein
MAQSGVDPTVKSYGVFINSNQSNPLTLDKSYASIPFQGNLADHDPNKAVQISMTSMLFTNTIFNITEENNQMRVLIYYAAGRGKAASKEERDITIPVGFYNITQLSNYLSKSGIMGREIVQQLFQYSNGLGGVNDTFCNIYEGFGAIPLDPNDPIDTKAAPTNESNTKIVFQSPDLAHMIQFGTDLTTATVNELDHSYIYQAIYVECPIQDTRFAPLLKMLGFFNIDSYPPPQIEESLIVGPPKTGYGIQFNAFEALPGAPNPIDNTVFYQIRDLDLLDPNVILGIPTQFHGIIYQNQSVVLTCAYELSATNQVIELPNGFFVQGTSISIPSPYVVGFQEAKFGATFTLGSDQMVVTPQSGNITVGMAVGIQYNPTTLIPLDLVDAADFNYATGTTPPGLENDHCFYVIQDLGGNVFRLNQNWTAPNLTTSFGYAISYILTTLQVVTPGGLVESMLASPTSVSEIAAVITPTNVTNLSGVDEIHCHCTQLRTQNLSSSGFQPLAPSDVIAVVPVEVEFGFKQNYQPPNPLTSYLTNTNVQQLDISLTDARGAPLNFNGVDWSMTFFITEVDAMSDVALNKSGNFNTPFQDQLSAMEGTAQAQNKRQQREIIFYDPSKKRNVGGSRSHYF